MKDNREMMIASLTQIVVHFKQEEIPVSEFCLIVWHEGTQLAELMGQGGKRPFLAHSVQPEDMPAALWELADALSDELTNAADGKKRPDIVSGHFEYDAQGNRTAHIDSS